MPLSRSHQYGETSSKMAVILNQYLFFKLIFGWITSTEKFLYVDCVFDSEKDFPKN